MNDNELIFGIMSSFGSKQFSFDDLMYLTNPFEISKPSLRTNLSRMIRENTIQSARNGKTAFYSLSQKGKWICSNVALSFKKSDWSQWDKDWWGLFFSVPEPQNQQRHKIRKKLILYRFANYYPGFWIRPLNPHEKIQDNFQSVIDTKKCTLIKFRFDQEITKEEIKKLWKLDDLNDSFEITMKKAQELLNKADEYKPEEGLYYKFLIGNDMVKALFNDPMLPNEFLPDNWKGNELRRLLLLFDKTMTEIAKPYVEKILKRDKEGL